MAPLSSPVRADTRDGECDHAAVPTHHCEHVGRHDAVHVGELRPADPGRGEGADAVLGYAGAVGDLKPPVSVVVDEPGANLGMPSPSEDEGEGDLEDGVLS